MCTLTFIPLPQERNGFIITSNRDEAVDRATAEPDFHFFDFKKLLFPKDLEAGGTWIGISETNRAICLLNGAFKAHKRKTSYIKSRGVLVKEFLSSDDWQSLHADYDFTGIEPFTMVIADYSQELELLEVVWDGDKKFLRQLPLAPHIWSSAPLYSEQIKKERNSWFLDFKKMGELEPDSLWGFHHTAGTGDNFKDLIIDRGFLKTTSITQIVHASKKTDIKYEDLKTGKITEKTFKIN